MALAATLVDAFDSGFNAGLWTRTNAVDVVVVSSIASLRATASYPSLNSLATYDLTASSVFIEVASPGDLSRANFSFAFHVQQTPEFNQYSFIWSGAFFSAGVQEAAGSSTWFVTTTYNPVAHRFVRIREAAGTIFWEVSSNGTAWNAFHSRAAAFAITGVSVAFSTGEAGIASGAETSVQIAGVNTVSLASTGQVTGTMPNNTFAAMTGSVSVSATASSVASAITMPTAANAILVVNTSSTLYVTVAMASSGATATLGAGVTLVPNGSIVLEATPLVGSVAAIGAAAGPTTVVFTPGRMLA